MKLEKLVYGLHATKALLRSKPKGIQQILVAKKNPRLQPLLELADEHRVPVREMDRKALDDIVPSAVHQGVIAELKDNYQGYQEEDLQEILAELDEPPFLLVLDGVQDPHNLGACLRTANAAGVHAVIIPKDNSCQLNATVRKVACGGAELVPLVRVTNLARCLAKLKDENIWIYGTCFEDSQEIYSTDLRGPIALVLGAEGKGIRRLTREACDGLVHIPQFGQVQSLNVSVATGVCLFEAQRQRQKA